MVIHVKLGLWLFLPQSDHLVVLAQLAIKDITVSTRHYILCRNEEAARKEAETWAKLIDNLPGQPAQGGTRLMGNKGYRRLLTAAKSQAFAIDPAKSLPLRRRCGMRTSNVCDGTFHAANRPGSRCAARRQVHHGDTKTSKQASDSAPREAPINSFLGVLVVNPFCRRSNTQVP